MESSTRPGTATLATKLEAARGIKLDQATINRQNNQLQGWSWIAGTFSWVEPTAWALLALRKRAAAGQRIDSRRLSEAEALLVDRCCEHGGWNYGNANMLGKELRPYVPTTAMALLALQKTEQPAGRCRREEPGISRSRGSIRAVSRRPVALGHGASRATRTRQTPSVRCSPLIADRAIDLGHQLGVATALYALQAEKADAFAL